MRQRFDPMRKSHPDRWKSVAALDRVRGRCLGFFSKTRGDTPSKYLPWIGPASKTPGDVFGRPLNLFCAPGTLP
jgi:hypothetical protein